MKNIFSPFNLKKYSDKDTHKWYPHIWRDWAVILFLGMVLTVSFLFFHFSLYMNMSTGGFFSQSSLPQKDASFLVDRNGLSVAVADFTKKKENSEAVLSDQSKIIDPSTGTVSLSDSKNPIQDNKEMKALFSQ